MTRLQKIANVAKELNVDAVMLTSEFNLHYATKYQRLEGIVIVDYDGNGVVFTDSRYIEDTTNKISPLGYKVIEPEGSYPTPQTGIDYITSKGYKTVAFENRAMTLAVYEEYKKMPAEMVALNGAIEELREIKEDEEIENIVKAQRIAEESVRRVMPLIKPGAYEDELCAKLRLEMALLGSTGFAPGMIFVSGATTSLPHGQPTHKQIQKGDFVTIDFGAEVEGYHSDITRTFAVGHATDEMKHIYNTVLEAQLVGIEAFEVGKMGKEVDGASRSVIEKAGFGQYFGHGLGHSIGLEVHEFPRANRTYEGHYKTRNITTIEPGIYIPGKFGVRIEDMIYLSENGKINLTNFEKELIIL